MPSFRKLFQVSANPLWPRCIIYSMHRFSLGGGCRQETAIALLVLTPVSCRDEISARGRILPTEDLNVPRGSIFSARGCSGSCYGTGVVPRGIAPAV